MAAAVDQIAGLAIDNVTLASLNGVICEPLEASTRYLVAEEGICSSAGCARTYCSTAGNPLPAIYVAKGNGPNVVFPVYPGWSLVEALCIHGIEQSLVRLHRVTLFKSCLERSTIWKGVHSKMLPSSLESYRHAIQKAEWKANNHDGRPLLYRS